MHDLPSLKTNAGPEIIAGMAAVAVEIRHRILVSIGSRYSGFRIQSQRDDEKSNRIENFEEQQVISEK